MVYSTEGGVFLSRGRCVRRLEYFIYVYYPLLTWRHLIETECKHEGFVLGLPLNLAAFALFISLVTSTGRRLKHINWSACTVVSILWSAHYTSAACSSWCASFLRVAFMRSARYSGLSSLQQAWTVQSTWMKSSFTFSKHQWCIPAAYKKSDFECPRNG